MICMGFFLPLVLVTNSRTRVNFHNRHHTVLSKDLKIVLQGDAITSNPKIKIACSSPKIATHSRILDHTGCGKTAYD